ncbi:MAG: hypothetical protein GQ565_11430 [Candidatus Aegiribacteria sp.]|nr:hypothetical protein [Candidatus Aegiribacteria sp.]
MSKIESISYTDDLYNGLRNLLSDSQYKPYRYLHRYVGDELVDMWQDIIADLLREEGNIFTQTLGSEIVGIVVCQDRSWESDVIGHKAAEIKYLITSKKINNEDIVLDHLLEQSIEWAQRHEIHYLLCKTNCDNIQSANALEKKGFLLTDTLLDYVYDMKKDPLENITIPPLYNGVTLRHAVPDDIEALVSVAQAAFSTHFGRFHQDDRLDNKRATHVYEEWIKASCTGYADWVVVAEMNGCIAGYSVWKKPSPREKKLSKRIGHYSIGAVHPDFAGHGLFSSLTYRGMQHLSTCSDCIEGPTHINNYGVQKAYSRLAWRICDARHSFRLWLS